MTKPAPPTRRASTVSKRKSSPPPGRTAPKKTFKVQFWDTKGHGKRIMVYADTGMGKTSLALLAPKPVFIGLDEGGRELRHPVTNVPLRYVPDVVTYEDVRNALQQPDIFDSDETVVIDTVTLLQDLAIPYMLANIKTEKGATVDNIVGYGYNKGYQHLYDVMKAILVDCDALIHKGKNVILIAQAIPHKVPNPGGEDYLRDGPRLYAGKPSVEALYCEWADHILRIDYTDVWVEKQNKKDTKGKATGNTTRIIYTQSEVYYRAKSRTLEDRAYTFDDKADDTVWQILFGGE